MLFKEEIITVTKEYPIARSVQGQVQGQRKLVL